MSIKEFFTVLKDSLQKHLLTFVLLIAVLLINTAVFVLYNLPSEPFLYTAVITFVIFLLAVIFDTYFSAKKYKIRKNIIKNPTDFENLHKLSTLEAKDLFKIILGLYNKLQDEISRNEAEKEDMTDYYTAWVHQIKTPISVMRIKLSENGTKENTALLNELIRIEQYVDMVLQYIRLESSSNDLVIKEYNIDSLLKSAVKKYASMFIARKILLNYKVENLTVTTDAKWFSVIIEQLLSNAVKYTSSGSVTVSADKNGVYISDTGIGIASEDIPRIFEKGYTGCNGRIEKRSSGLGLYLCKKACDKLNISVKCESTVGIGTKFTLKFNGTKN